MKVQYLNDSFLYFVPAIIFLPGIMKHHTKRLLVCEKDEKSKYKCKETKLNKHRKKRNRIMALNLMLLFRCKKILVDQQIWKKGRCNLFICRDLKIPLSPSTPTFFYLRLLPVISTRTQI